MDPLNDLQEILQGIEQKAREQGLYLVQGPRFFLKGNRSPEIDWEGEWTEYLEVAGSVKATLLYLQAEPFDLERQNASLIAGRKRGKLREPDNKEWLWLSQRVMEQTEEWSTYNGRIGYLECAWFKEGVGHYFSLETEWYAEHSEAVSAALDEAEKVEAENRSIHTREEAKSRLQQARQLANHERFADASNDEKRQYMAEQLLSDLDEYSLRPVISLAQAVYWWEVAPRERAAKEQKARDLRAKGENIKNIAILLGMSEAKVRAAIEGADSEAK